MERRCLFVVVIIIVAVSLSFGQVDTLFFEGFEGIFPGTNWVVGDSNPFGGFDYWDDTNVRAHTGNWAGWCADIGEQIGTSYGANTTDQDIYDYTCVTSTINAVGEAIASCDIIDSILVHIVIFHTYRGDLVIRLFSPANADTFVLLRHSGGSVQNLDSVFTLSGSSVGSVDSANGTWRLVVCDSAAGDVGYLDYWDIRIFYHQYNTCTHQYDNYMDAYLTRTFDLDSTNHKGCDLILSFWHLMPSIETGGFDWGAVYIDGMQVGPRFQSQITSWTQVTMNLTDSLAILPLGRGRHTLTFKFHSDVSVRGEGWYIDDIALIARKPNLQPYPAFTGGIIVPSNVTGTQTVSSVLTGNGTTYLDAWTVKNTSIYDATDSSLVRVLVDGVALTAYDRLLPRLNVNDTAFSLDRPITVKGGRHTLTTVVDATSRIDESNEEDNAYSVQFVWSPLTLSQGTPITRTDPPERGGFTYPNCDGFAFGQTYYWSICAIRPPYTTDYDMQLYYGYTNSTSGFDSASTGSYFGSGEIDFVLRDGNHSYVLNNYVGVYKFRGSGNFTIEADFNSEMISSGSNGPFTVTPSNIARVWDTYLAPNTRYFFLLQNRVDGVGDADLDIYLFSSADGIYTKSRYDYVAYSSTTGPGGDEMFSYTTPPGSEGDWYGFVVINRGATTNTSYRIIRRTTPLYKVTVNISGLPGSDSTTLRYTLLGNLQSVRVNTSWTGYVDSNTVVSVDGIVNSSTPDVRYFASSPYWWLIKSDTTESVTYRPQFRIIASALTAPAGPGSQSLNDTNSVSIWCEVPSNFEDISNYPGRQEVWNDGTNHDDESVGPLPIGFSFPYFGSSYSSFYITSNGFIVLGIAYPSYSPIPYEGCLRTGGLFSLAIMPYGRDLIYRGTGVPNRSHIYYFNLPNPTRLVVQFQNMYAYGSTEGICDFEIVLYASGQIDFYYKSVLSAALPVEIGIAELEGKYFNDAPSESIAAGAGYSFFGGQYRSWDSFSDTLWVTSGFHYYFASASNFSDETHRWKTPLDTAYIAGSPTTTNLRYFEQFYNTFQASVVPPGLPMSPTNNLEVRGYQFGVLLVLGSIWDGHTIGDWVDAFPTDTAQYIRFSPLSSGSDEMERWTHSPTGAGSALWACTTSTTLSATYYHQTRDIVSVSTHTGGVPMDSMNYIFVKYTSCGGPQAGLSYDGNPESIWVDMGDTVSVDSLSSASMSSLTGGATGNLALFASASSSGGGTDEYSPEKMNDNNPDSYHWVNPGPGSFIELAWSTEQTIAWMRIKTGDCENVLSGGNIVYWDGTRWISVASISGERSSWTYVFSRPISTTKLRITDITGYGSGDRDNAHPLISEWEVYSSKAFSTRRWKYCGATDDLKFAPSGTTHSFTYYNQGLVSTASSRANPAACTHPLPTDLQMIYMECGNPISDTLGKTIWQDIGDTIRLSARVISATEQWVPSPDNVVVLEPGNITARFYHQYYVRFNPPVKLNGADCSHSVPVFNLQERYNLGVNRAVQADGNQYWTDCGSTYSYEDPKIISGVERWDISAGGTGTISAATTIEPFVYHQWRPTVYLLGSTSPDYLVSTDYHFQLGVNVGDADNFGQWTDWVDCGSLLSFARCTHPRTPARCTDDMTTWPSLVSSFTDTIRYGFIRVIVRTNYSGGWVVVDNDTLASPDTLLWEPGSVHNIGVVSPHTIGLTRWVWYQWSDRGDLFHNVIANPDEYIYTAYFLREYQCVVQKSPPQAYGSIIIRDTTYNNVASRTFWAKGDSGVRIGVSGTDYGSSYFYTFVRWSDGGERIHTTAPITAPTTFIAYYDSTAIALNISTSRIVWDLGRINPLATIVAEDSQMIFITNLSNVPITLGLRVLDSAGVWFASLYPDSNKFVMRARFNDLFTHPPISEFNPVNDAVFSSGIRWASSTVFGPGGFNIPPPPARENTENLWLMFIAPSYSSDWLVHTLRLIVTSKLYLP